MFAAYTVDGLIFVGYQFLWFSWRFQSTNSSTHEIVIFCMNYEGKYTMATNFEPNECVIYVQSTKIGTHENKAIHSMQAKYITAFSSSKARVPHHFQYSRGPGDFHIDPTEEHMAYRGRTTG